MPLPTDFAFSQNNLQDFVDCPRRFQLRYLLHTTWPAPISEPAEAHDHLIELGNQFHRMVHRYFLGIPEELISNQVDDVDLKMWWESFLAKPPVDLPKILLPEYYHSIPFEGYRLVAKIDLLAIEKNKRAVIVDWKTTHKPPNQNFVKNRIQSLVYPYLVMQPGLKQNNSVPFTHEQVCMVYWYPGFPENSVILKFESDWLNFAHNQLTQIIRQIINMNLEVFPLTSDIEKCKFCRFRSLCERGVTAGKMDDEEEFAFEDDDNFEINFDDIHGIAF